jgi:amino-acid N-acetyltransferase
MSILEHAPRSATTADLPAILSLLEAEDLPLAGLGQTALWVALAADGTAAGVVGLEVPPEGRGDGLLRSLAVAQGLRGTGLGRALVAHVVAQAQRRHLLRLWAVTTTADAFLSRQGFAPMTRDDVPPALKASPELSGACPDDARIYRREL